MFKTALAGWLARRVFDWGGQWAGWVGGLLTLYGLMPEEMKRTLLALLTGNWGEVTLAAGWGFAIWAGSQLFSLRATIKPQVVSDDGKKVEMKELPKTTQTEVKQKVDAAVEKKRPTLNPLEALGGLFKRK